MPIVQRPLAAVIAGDREAVARAGRPRGRRGRGHRPSLRRGRARLRARGRRRRPGCRRSGHDRVRGGPPALRRPARGGDRVLERRGGRAAPRRRPHPRVPRRRLRRPALPRAGAGRRTTPIRRSPTTSARQPPPATRTLVADPEAALDDLLAAAEGLDEAEQRAQLDALTTADAFSPAGGFDEEALRDWADWDLEHGIVDEPIDVDAAFVGILKGSDPFRFGAGGRPAPASRARGASAGPRGRCPAASAACFVVDVGVLVEAEHGRAEADERLGRLAVEVGDDRSRRGRGRRPRRSQGPARPRGRRR